MTLGTGGQCKASRKLDFDESQSDAITRSLFGISQQSLKITSKHCQNGPINVTRCPVVLLIIIEIFPAALYRLNMIFPAIFHAATHRVSMASTTNKVMMMGDKRMGIV